MYLLISERLIGPHKKIFSSRSYEKGSRYYELIYFVISRQDFIITRKDLVITG